MGYLSFVLLLSWFTQAVAFAPLYHVLYHVLTRDGKVSPTAPFKQQSRWLPALCFFAAGQLIFDAIVACVLQQDVSFTTGALASGCMQAVVLLFTVCSLCWIGFASFSLISAMFAQSTLWIVIWLAAKYNDDNASSSLHVTAETSISSIALLFFLVLTTIALQLVVAGIFKQPHAASTTHVGDPDKQLISSAEMLRPVPRVDTSFESRLQDSAATLLRSLTVYNSSSELPLANPKHLRALSDAVVYLETRKALPNSKSKLLFPTSSFSASPLLPPRFSFDVQLTEQPSSPYQVLLESPRHISRQGHNFSSDDDLNWQLDMKRAWSASSVQDYCSVNDRGTSSSDRLKVPFHPVTVERKLTDRGDIASASACKRLSFAGCVTSSFAGMMSCFSLLPLYAENAHGMQRLPDITVSAVPTHAVVLITILSLALTDYSVRRFVYGSARDVENALLFQPLLLAFKSRSIALPSRSSSLLRMHTIPRKSWRNLLVFGTPMNWALLLTLAGAGNAFSFWFQDHVMAENLDEFGWYYFSYPNDHFAPITEFVPATFSVLLSMILFAEHRFKPALSRKSTATNWTLVSLWSIASILAILAQFCAISNIFQRTVD